MLQLSALQTRLAILAAAAVGVGSSDGGPTCYDVREVAERLKMDVSYVYKLVKRGELTAFKQGRVVRVRREDLERFIQQRLNGGAVATAKR
ncbi:MAG TPA: helix-turn-helix domain-containing protein [Vicinamibacterales bacterium]|nr:helix-turn-helix domain-containing protein [Vicinamibacterales bacterium]